MESIGSTISLFSMAANGPGVSLGESHGTPKKCGLDFQEMEKHVGKTSVVHEMTWFLYVFVGWGDQQQHQVIKK